MMQMGGVLGLLCAGLLKLFITTPTITTSPSSSSILTFRAIVLKIKQKLFEKLGQGAVEKPQNAKKWGNGPQKPDLYAYPKIP
jgi:hypothetical protein